MDNETLATEMLRELKATSKRKDGIIVLLIFVIVFLIGMFIWYINIPVEETIYTQDATTQGDEAPISQDIGE